jgi:cobalt-precorrin-5B (C1)-methyltransferase
MENRAILDKYHLKESEYGITTGSAATGAALAALLSIKGKVKDIDIETPLGDINIRVNVSEKLDSYSGRASVVKYPYNDPDVTKNIEIFADLFLTSTPSIIIKGGEGVGIVTKPGLQVPVGEAAINPTPREMIISNLKKYLTDDMGANVIINVPGGKELAKKTLNSRLGIVDGISILGTTGFARSMNLKSYKTSYRCQIDVAVAEGYSELIFVPGNIGESIARRVLNVADDQIIQMGNFVGYMLSEAEKKGVNKIILLGHAGKLIKISAGIFNTKHSIADGRREIIAVHSALVGADKRVINEIFRSNTTEDMITILERHSIVNQVFNSITDRIKEICIDRFNIDFDVIIVNMKGQFLNNNYDPLNTHLKNII